MQLLALWLPILVAYWMDELWIGLATGTFLWWLLDKQRRLQAELVQQALQERVAKLEQLLHSRQSAPDRQPNRQAAPETGTAANRAAARHAPAAPVLTVPAPQPSTASGDAPALQPAPAKTAAPATKSGVTLIRTPHQAVRRRPAPPAVKTPTAPNPVAAWFMRGNPLLKTGLVVLFLGLAFLLRFASERVHVPIEMRYLSVAAAGLAAALAGWKLQSRRREYGLVLQGFGLAVMYLTALAALKLHPLLPAGVVFALMVALVSSMAALAVRQNALPLAQVALVGGLAAPVLVSEGSGHYLVLFGYLALLNTGVAAIARFKAWRSLNLTGWLGTVLIASSWGAAAYTPAHLSTTEPFLLYHWLLYTWIVYQFAQRRAEDPAPLRPLPDHVPLALIGRRLLQNSLHIGRLDGSLLFGSALSTFGLQYAMLANWPDAPAWAALGFALVYALWSGWSRQRQLPVLPQAFALLALLFATLAIPLAFEQQWTAAAWTVEAALVYYFGLRQKQPHTRVFALAVYALAALRQLGTLTWNGDLIETLSPMLQGSAFGTLLTAAGGAFVYAAWHRYRRTGSAAWEQSAQTAVLALTLLHTTLLPLLCLLPPLTMTVVAALAACWAWCQRRFPESVWGWAALFCTAGMPLLLLPSFSSSPVYAYVSALLLAAAAYGLHQSLDTANRSRSFVRSMNSGGFLILAMALGIGLLALNEALHDLAGHDVHHFTLPVLFAPLAWAARRLSWRQGTQAALLFTPAFALYVFNRSLHEAWLSGSLLLLAATALHVYTFHALIAAERLRTHARLAGLLLMLAAWTYFFGLSGETYLSGVWAQLGWLAPALLLWLLLMGAHRLPWLPAQPPAFLQASRLLCAAVAALWLLWASWVQPGVTAPLPYFPLLNPLDSLCLLLLWLGWHTTSRLDNEADGRLGFGLTALLGFIALSAAVMRGWHFLGGVEWQLSSLLASFGLQASLSIVWAAAAIALMVRGHQHGERQLWLLGAGWMAVVVGKLFLVELGNSGGIARIVSFIVVGVLLLLVGWFAPVPPKQAAKPTDEDKTD